MLIQYSQYLPILQIGRQHQATRCDEAAAKQSHRKAPGLRLTDYPALPPHMLSFLSLTPADQPRTGERYGTTVMTPAMPTSPGPP